MKHKNIKKDATEITPVMVRSQKTTTKNYRGIFSYNIVAFSFLLFRTQR